MLMGSDGRSEFIVPLTFRFVFALPTNEHLEAMREPQVVPTSSDQTNRRPKAGSEYATTGIIVALLSGIRLSLGRLTTSAARPLYPREMG